MPEISALLRARQEVNKFKVSLGYIVRLHAKSNQIKTNHHHHHSHAKLSVSLKWPWVTARTSPPKWPWVTARTSPPKRPWVTASTSPPWSHSLLKHVPSGIDDGQLPLSSSTSGSLKTESKLRKGVVAGKIELFYSLPNLGARALKMPMTTAGTKLNIIFPLTFSSSPVPALVSVTPSWGPTALCRLSLLCDIGISFINLSCSSLLGSSVLRDRSCPSISGKRHRLPKSCDMS